MPPGLDAQKGIETAFRLCRDRWQKALPHVAELTLLPQQDVTSEHREQGVQD
jgi:hypothetical protein